MNAAEAKPAPAAGSWIIWIRWAAVLILAAMLLLPIWIVAFPPLLDLSESSGARVCPFALEGSEFFVPANFIVLIGALIRISGWTRLSPSWLGLFPIETAGRINLSLCVLALPTAVWFFFARRSQRSEAAFLWSLLIAYNVFFLEAISEFRFEHRPRTFRAWLVAALACTARIGALVRGSRCIHGVVFRAPARFRAGRVDRREPTSRSRPGHFVIGSGAPRWPCRASRFTCAIRASALPPTRFSFMGLMTSWTRSAL